MEEISFSNIQLKRTKQRQLSGATIFRSSLCSPRAIFESGRRSAPDVRSLSASSITHTALLPPCQIWSLEESGGHCASPTAGQSEIRLGSLVRLCSFLFLEKFIVVSGAWGKAAMCSNLVWTLFPYDFENCQGYLCRISYVILRIVKAIHVE